MATAAPSPTSPRPPVPPLRARAGRPLACSIVIRSYNEEQHIGRLLTGIMEQTVRDVDIILVDSGSTDATVAIASQFPVRILHIDPEDFSFGRSLNLGCAAAQKEFIVLASAHVYPVYTDWLEQLLVPFTRDERLALVYGQQRGGETTKYAEHQLFAQWFGEESVARQRHPFCNNANAAIRRARWQERPYDEELTGLEDLDWANDALARGHHLAYAAEAPVIHLHDETPRRVYNRYRREALAHRAIFPEQRFSLLDFVRFAATNIASDYFHARHDGVLLKNLTAIPAFRLCQFWGTYRGFAQQAPVTARLKETFYYPRGRDRTDRPADPARERRAIDYTRAGRMAVGA